MSDRWTQSAFVAVILCLAIGPFVVFAWDIGLISHQICRENPYTYQEKCTTNDIVHVLLWHLGKFLDDVAVAVTAIATGAVAIFTATLWRATSGLLSAAENQQRDMQESLRIASETAEAVKLQTRAAVASQLPVIGWVGQKLIAINFFDGSTIDPAPFGKPPATFRPVVTVKNAGPTRVLFWRFAIKCEVVRTLAPEPFYGGMFTGESIIVEAGNAYSFTTNEITVTTKDQRTQIESGDARLWIYGFLTYNDFLDEMHQLGFCFRWSVDPAVGFVRDGPDTYTYHTHEKTYTRPTS